jgi:hypothetical protein
MAPDSVRSSFMTGHEAWSSGASATADIVVLRMVADMAAGVRAGAAARLPGLPARAAEEAAVVVVAIQPAGGSAPGCRLAAPRIPRSSDRPPRWALEFAARAGGDHSRWR